MNGKRGVRQKEGRREFDGRGEGELGWWEIRARRVEGVDKREEMK